jgi:Fe-S-cluster containining protein
MFEEAKLKETFNEAMSIFNCQQCGTCCVGKGGITITMEEVPRIAAFLYRTPEEFLSAFTVARNGKIYIREGADGACVFNLKSCLIHPVKPVPCRKWPFFEPMLKDQDNWNVARNACRGLAPFASLKDFLAQKESREDNPAKD